MAVKLQTLINRSVENMRSGINPTVKDTALEVIKRAYKEKIYVQMTSGYRSIGEQNTLYEQGRTNRSKPIVTNVRGGHSYHNYGLAVDFVILSDNGRRALWTVNEKWRQVANLAKALGFTWGGDWSGFKDYSHLQMNGGLTINDLLNGKRPKLISKIETSGLNTSIEYRLKSPYMRGANIKRIQEAVGMSKKQIDGIYGPITEKAVKAFQKENGLVIDGIVAKETWDKLF